MGQFFSPIVDFVSAYSGYFIGFAALAFILLLNQLTYRRSWKSYPSLEEYLAAHPKCRTAKGPTCHKCDQKAEGGPVIGAGRLYSCAWCETELFKVDRQNAAR